MLSTDREVTLTWNDGRNYTWVPEGNGIWSPRPAGPNPSPVARVYAQGPHPSPLFLFPGLKDLPSALCFYFPNDRPEYFCPIFGRPFRFMERHATLRRMATLKVQVTVWAVPESIRDPLLYAESVLPFCVETTEIVLTPQTDEKNKSLSEGNNFL